jgi:hypothetical protein
VEAWRKPLQNRSHTLKKWDNSAEFGEWLKMDHAKAKLGLTSDKEIHKAI